MVRRIVLIFVAIVLMHFNTIAQLAIKGIVLNKNGERLPYVNIFIENSENEGCSSNGDGEFSLYINKPIVNKTIVFSSIGYKTLKINTSKNLFNKSNKFVLSEDVTVLDEVVITPINILDTINKAISLVFVNHPNKNYEAFYRGYMKQNNNWVRFIEASININNYGLTKSKNNKYSICLNQIRTSHDKVDKKAIVKTSPFFLLNKVGTISPSRYNFTLKDVIMYNGGYVYVVEFVPKSKKQKYRGLLYIDTQTLGFHKITMSITEDYKQRMKKKRKWTKINGKFVRYNFFYEYWNMNISFKKVNNVFYFDKIIYKSYSINNLIKSKKQLFSYEVFDEIYINKIINNKKCQSIIENYTDIYKLKKLPEYIPQFWQNYNFSVRDSIQRSAIKILNH